ncbi:unnamed protein product [Amoebophrya sp. A25]|nr:unnamed protein product [Amoebophrya sp. A25]|eukprot:GSA25T00021605001.1
MAEAIELAAEGWVGALHELLEWGVFSEKEVAKIVNTRKDHEYKMASLIRQGKKKRTPAFGLGTTITTTSTTGSSASSSTASAGAAGNADTSAAVEGGAAVKSSQASMLDAYGRACLTAIQYEIALDLLRQERMTELQLPVQKTTESSLSGMRRITVLFRRLCNRTPADIKAWLQFADFLLRSGQTKQLKEVVFQALRHHSRNTQLWLLAARREAEEGNRHATRNLFLRSLRFLPADLGVLREYFKWELKGARSLIERSLVTELRPGGSASNCAYTTEDFANAARLLLPTSAVLRGGIRRNRALAAAAIPFLEACGELICIPAAKNVFAEITTEDQASFDRSQNDTGSTKSAAQNFVDRWMEWEREYDTALGGAKPATAASSRQKDLTSDATTEPETPSCYFPTDEAGPDEKAQLASTETDQQKLMGEDDVTDNDDEEEDSDEEEETEDDDSEDDEDIQLRPIQFGSTNESIADKKKSFYESKADKKEGSNASDDEEGEISDEEEEEDSVDEGSDLADENEGGLSNSVESKRRKVEVP